MADELQKKLMGYWLIDPASMDKTWSQEFNYGAPGRLENTYYDYYYSGQDIHVSIDGIEASSKFYNLPIMSFAFNVQQQKTPIYGFWDFVYSGVMRGTRIVNGAFTIATRSVNYMKDVLSEAAQYKAKKSYYYSRPLTNDDVNLQKFWGINKLSDPALQMPNVYSKVELRNIFSIHPPFSFVIKYGWQDTSVQHPASTTGEIPSWVSDWDQLATEGSMFTDTNERLVDPSIVPSGYGFVCYLDACEITGMQTSFDTNGQPIAETYSFFARDMLDTTSDQFHEMNDYVGNPNNRAPDTIDTSGMTLND